jgi:hypothetical protein
MYESAMGSGRKECVQNLMGKRLGRWLFIKPRRRWEDT